MAASFQPSTACQSRRRRSQKRRRIAAELAESHYENFHVATWFLPKRLRPHFQSIYAYCRISDDLGDEVGDAQESLALLNFWNDQLDACYRGSHASSRVCCTGGNHSCLQHSQDTVRRLAGGISPGSDGAAISHHAGCVRLLPQFCQSGGAPCVVCLRLSRAGVICTFGFHLHRAAAGKFLAGCA